MNFEEIFWGLLLHIVLKSWLKFYDFWQLFEWVLPFSPKAARAEICILDHLVCAYRTVQFTLRICVFLRSLLILLQHLPSLIPKVSRYSIAT